MKRSIPAIAGLMLFMLACNTGDSTTETGSTATSETSATNTQENKEERNKQTALASVRSLLDTRNVDEALKHGAPDAVDYYDGSGPPVKGLDSIKASMKMWLGNMDEYKADNIEAFADGNKVVVTGDWSGKFKGDFMGMKTGGKSFKMRDADIFTFNDQGQIIEHRSLLPLSCMLATLSDK